LTIRCLKINGLTVNVVDGNTGDGVDHQLMQTPAQTLAPGAEQSFKLIITAGNVDVSQANFSVSATTNEGSYEEAKLFVHLVEAVPIAFVNPTSITAGINPDDIMVRTVNITNRGYETMNDINISKPTLDWISVTSTDPGSISPGMSKSFDIILHPTNDTVPGVYQETITITSSNHQSVNIYLTISITSSQQGDIMFHVINDINEEIFGASIVIQNQDVLTQVFSGTTNDTGYCLFDGISTGRYNYFVQASDHGSVSDSIIVSPEIQTFVEPVLTKSILGVQLTVTPIQVGDEYDIELNLTFETEVPPPILIPSPLYISYGVNFTDPEYENNSNITISNPGLISVFNVTVDSSFLAGVNITFPTGNTFFIDEMPAKSSVTIPYHLNVTYVTCDTDNKRNSIKIRGDYIYFEEYSDVTHNVYLYSEIPVFIHMYNCPVDPGNPIDEIIEHFTHSYHPPCGSYSSGDGTSLPKLIQPVETVRERVKFSISQEATLERDAFAASLEMTNKLADKNIEGVKVELNIKEIDGSDASDMFFVNQTFLNNINSIDGSGVINPSAIASADWLLVPKSGAGGTDPAGMDYTVQAFIDYVVDGVPFSVNSTEERINVMPQPLLNLTYMIPGEVKADTPFNITLNVTNVGYGTARNLKLDSAQPVIYENLAGLLVSFELIGSGIEGGDESDSMLLEFGDIGPGESKTGYWVMTASLDGEFTEFKGSFSHSNEMGGEDTSLIENITYVIYTPDGPPDRTLLQVEGQSEIYWLQNDRLYWVTDWDVINNMTGVPGWDSVNTLSVSEFDPVDYEQGPRFITTDTISDGLLLREQSDIKVYLVSGGEKHHFISEEVFLSMGYSFDNVIDVSPQIIQMFPTGNDIGTDPISVGQGAPTPEIEQLFIDAYNRNGGADVLGSPTTEVHVRWGYLVQEFLGASDYAGGKIMYNPYKNYAYYIHGAIWERYYKLGGPTAVTDESFELGPPTSDIEPYVHTQDPAVSSHETEFRYQNFEGGSLEQNLSSGMVYEVHGAICNKWKQLGAASSGLGLPTTDEKEVVVSTLIFTGRYSEFEGGIIHWIRELNQVWVIGLNQPDAKKIMAKYYSEGGSGGWLGFPVSNDYINPSGYLQCDFEGGYIATTDGVNYEAFEYADKEPPTLLIKTPEYGDDAESYRIEVSGSASDESGMYCIMVNRNPIAYYNTDIWNTNVELQAGENKISITAIDKYHNSITKTIMVYYNPDFSFAHITDVHVGVGIPSMTERLKRITKALTQIRDDVKPQADFVLITGDLVG